MLFIGWLLLVSVHLVACAGSDDSTTADSTDSAVDSGISTFTVSVDDASYAGSCPGQRGLSHGTGEGPYIDTFPSCAYSKEEPRIQLEIEFSDPIPAGGVVPGTYSLGGDAPPPIAVFLGIGNLAAQTIDGVIPTASYGLPVGGASGEVTVGRYSDWYAAYDVTISNVELALITSSFDGLYPPTVTVSSAHFEYVR